MTLHDYRVNLGWDWTEFARQAGLNAPVVRRAERGGPVKAASAKKMADAFSKAYGKEIKPTDIEGLNIM